MTIDWGFVVFVLVVMVDVVALLFDAIVFMAGKPLISDYVWAHQWLGILLVLGQSAGVAGLAWHFWRRSV